MRVLVVEDDRRLAESLRRSLMESRMAVDVTHNGQDGLAAASTTPYDVIVLDLMLPLLDGLEVARRLREHKVDTPILMLTARDGVDDRVERAGPGDTKSSRGGLAAALVTLPIGTITGAAMPNMSVKIPAFIQLLETDV